MLKLLVRKESAKLKRVNILVGRAYADKIFVVLRVYSY